MKGLADHRKDLVGELLEIREKQHKVSLQAATLEDDPKVVSYTKLRAKERELETRADLIARQIGDSFTWSSKR